MACQSVDWICVAQVRGKIWAAVDVDPNVRIAWHADSLTRWTTVS